MARRVQTPEGNIMPGFHIVSKNPWIIHCYNFGNIFSPIKQLAPYLLRPARGRIHFVLTLNWSILPRRKFEAFNRAYHRHLRRYPHLVVTVLANEPDELQLLREHGIRSELCNQNAFLDERLYTIQDEKKHYDAVINSRMAPYKRIELVRDIQNCCLITYFLDPQDYEYVKTVLPLSEKYKSACPHLHFPQYNGRTWQHYNIEEICKVYASSHCGVILSAEEGACFAAMEYLLCGLPVVTTPSIGGREAFFDKDYVIWTEPVPEAVAEAVKKARQLPVSAQEIRDRTIAGMQSVRAVYCEILNSIAREEGVERDFRAEWDSFFINKMHTNMSEPDAVAFLRAQGLNLHYPLLHRLHNGHKVFKAWLKGLKQTWRERESPSHVKLIHPIRIVSL